MTTEATGYVWRAVRQLSGPDRGHTYLFSRSGKKIANYGGHNEAATAAANALNAHDGLGIDPFQPGQNVDYRGHKRMQPSEETNPYIMAENALGVIVNDSSISFYLKTYDPKALEQAQAAFEAIRAANNG